MSIREGLLALLHDGPRHGYQLKTEFEAATGGVWPLNVGQVYTTLDRLERDGMVHAHEANGISAAGVDTGRAGQRTYALTPAGEAELKAWFTTTAPEGPPPRDELMLKVLMAVGVGHAQAVQVVTRQRTVLLAHLQRVRRERAGADGDLAARLVTEALVARAEADLRWLDSCETHLLADRRRR